MEVLIKSIVCITIIVTHVCYVIYLTKQQEDMKKEFKKYCSPHNLVQYNFYKDNNYLVICLQPNGKYKTILVKY